MATPHDYTQFDQSLLEHIAGGSNTAAALTGHLGAQAKPFMNAPGEEFRVVDRRLQALRKKGRIDWRRLGRHAVWHIVDVE